MKNKCNIAILLSCIAINFHKTVGLNGASTALSGPSESSGHHKPNERGQTGLQSADEATGFIQRAG